MSFECDERTHQETTGKVCLFVLAVLTFTLDAPGQNAVPIIKAEAVSAFVWGEDSPSGAVSSTVRDPLTGKAIHRLSYAGIEVSSQIGFELASPGEVGTLLNYATSIVNSTDASLSVRYGGISVDGRLASPLWVVPAGEKLNKKEHTTRRDTVELEKVHCLTSGFLSSDNFFLAHDLSQVITVAPGRALTVSSVIRDPRTYHSVRCSIAGCYPTGTIRYYVRVDDKDYVFIWPGRAAIYCGG